MRANIIAIRLRKMYNVNYDDVGVVIVEDATYDDTLYADDTVELERSTYDVHFFDFPKMNEGNLLFVHKNYQHGVNITSTLMCPNPIVFYYWGGQAMQLKIKK